MTNAKSRRLAREITDELFGRTYAEMTVARAGGERHRISREDAIAAIVKILLTPKPQPQPANA